MSQVRLSDVTKVYDDILALEEIDLTVEDGEFLVMVGPSGCGKSTTLHMIAGLETITADEVGARVDSEFHLKSGEPIALDSESADVHFFGQDGDHVLIEDEPEPVKPPEP